jgi:hypothetical protein
MSPLGRPQHRVTARIKEFAYPPVHDGLVLGKLSPIGSAAIRKALSLVVAAPFHHIEHIEDDTIGDILVRESILRRVSKEQLIRFVLEKIKPLMGPEEILHLDLEVEVTIQEERL